VRVGDREWRERFDRERASFDRMFRIVFPIALVLGILGAVATIVLYLAGAAWLWSLIP
jgi:hypothetical protein